MYAVPLALSNLLHFLYHPHIPRWLHICAWKVHSQCPIFQIHDLNVYVHDIADKETQKTLWVSIEAYSKALYKIKCDNQIEEDNFLLR